MVREQQREDKSFWSKDLRRSSWISAVANHRRLVRHSIAVRPQADQ